MSQGLIIIIALVIIVYTAVSFMTHLYIYEDCCCSISDYDLSPKYLLKETNMNTVGVVLSTIGLTLIAPFYMIPMFIYWVCHVKKKDLKKEYYKEDYD